MYTIEYKCSICHVQTGEPKSMEEVGSALGAWQQEPTVWEYVCKNCFRSDLDTLTHEFNVERKHLCPNDSTPLRVKGWGTTLVGYRKYFDDDGAYHEHDDNCAGGEIRCPTCGNRWEYRPRRFCTAEGCDWQGKEECWCSVGGEGSKHVSVEEALK